MKAFKLMLMLWVVSSTVLFAQPFDAKNIPLPEHPRPDFMRADWLNLNGPWQFAFDTEDSGVDQGWFDGKHEFDKTIMVPFSWGSKLSGVADEGDIGWYRKTITVPAAWSGKRVFVVVGACDWHTTAWLNGEQLGTHQGGYTPFEFELPAGTQSGELVLRVDDIKRDFKLYGKQGYGRAAGIWQTIYLEARPDVYVETVHFTPDIDKNEVTVELMLNAPAPKNLSLDLVFAVNGNKETSYSGDIARGKDEVTFVVPIENAKLWYLDDPNLYDVNVKLDKDELATYFGMRKISVVNLPGSEIPYIALNNEPVYLQTTLDQAYHPEGYYTFPSDDFMRDEILRSRRIGLNGQRVHIKVEIPRKLYWADKLGMFIMADVPNSWGNPDKDMQKETEYAMRQMVKRDYNHPAIFSWVLFNETWGLKTDGKYLPKTQKWVAEMYHKAKELDKTRLIEDNSACLYDHVITDINSWHDYKAGYQWKSVLDNVVKNTYEGSTWNYAKGYKQDKDPLFNSECGNVWGYEGSTGDVDWSFDYHWMMNEFRRRPQICGWLYTEHHDVINEWNGYYKYDRSQKFTGMGDIVEGMGLNDMHSPSYIVVGEQICEDVSTGETLDVPVFASFMTDKNYAMGLELEASLFGWTTTGEYKEYWKTTVPVPYLPWLNHKLDPLSVVMPDAPGLAILAVRLVDPTGTVLHRNFTAFQVIGKNLYPDEKQLVLSAEARDFTDSKWSVKQWDVLDGLKVNGAGSGYFEYRLPVPKTLDVDLVDEAVFRAELGAKQLFGKDQDNQTDMDGNYMLGKGTNDPSRNPNSYPMTDETLYPSMVQVIINGVSCGVFDLKDDPADHRGLLSWHNQPHDRKLREAGSYGYLVNAVLPEKVIRDAIKTGELVVRLQVGDALPGGLAVYGEKFGRYPLDPTVIFQMK